MMKSVIIIALIVLSLSMTSCVRQSQVDNGDELTAENWYNDTFIKLVEKELPVRYNAEAESLIERGESHAIKNLLDMYLGLTDITGDGIPEIFCGSAGNMAGTHSDIIYDVISLPNDGHLYDADGDEMYLFGLPEYHSLKLFNDCFYTDSTNQKYFISSVSNLKADEYFFIRKFLEDDAGWHEMKLDSWDDYSTSDVSTPLVTHVANIDPDNLVEDVKRCALDYIAKLNQ